MNKPRDITYIFKHNLIQGKIVSLAEIRKSKELENKPQYNPSPSIMLSDFELIHEVKKPNKPDYLTLVTP